MHHRSSRHGKDGILSNRVVGGVGWVSGGRNNGSEAFALVDKVLYSCFSNLLWCITYDIPVGRQHSGQRSALCMPK